MCKEFIKIPNDIMTMEISWLDKKGMPQVRQFDICPSCREKFFSWKDKILEEAMA
jgi:NADPH-dependent 7-cyano-7-deazaguanine reductase QueF-like protein